MDLWDSGHIPSCAYSMWSGRQAAKPRSSFNFPSWLHCLQPRNKPSLNTPLYTCNVFLALLPTRSPPRTNPSLDSDIGLVMKHARVVSNQRASSPSHSFFRGAIIAVRPIRRRTRNYLKAPAGLNGSIRVWNEVSLQHPLRLHLASLASGSH